MSSSTLIRNAEVDGVVTDVRIDGTAIVEIGERLRRPVGAEEVSAGGGALIAGLHDHHLHIAAMAAARASVDLGALDDGRMADVLSNADRVLPRGTWLRVVGFHERLESGLDRWKLDQVVPDRPVRVQHRSGRRWILNSRALELCGFGDVGALPEGVELDSHGRPSGLVTGLDATLRARWAPDTDLTPLIAQVSAQLAAFGVTGVTDATPYDRMADLAPLLHALRDGSLRQHLMVTGSPALRPTPDEVSPGSLGPAKIVVADHLPLSIDTLVGEINAAREQDRSVAVHCVTRIALVVCLAAFEETGTRTGDRIEHASVADPELRARLAELGLAVVTQPNFVHERGDEYLADVDADDRPHLYPCASLLLAGVEVGGSTDAPFGNPDPWRSMRAASERLTRTGRAVGHDERIDPRRALDLFLSAPYRPGGPARTVAVGGRADLCLLRTSLNVTLESFDAENVRMTWIAGKPAFART